ncbi:hypothetical protein [Flagellimonas lutaonensis]|uniref:Uncharacterized protein n=1 Tax=Flagellimonas lutaonensis TaxID=516051 RepID=A0A0D5YTR6_9FLAO|nr:hypothetical protein [Allomuricauda lutaonensis]AKA35289.1 hypothetical protein VC82_1676 [Allomuricauda lutaonensis]
MMEILFYLATLFLILFMVLATFDGFYLHIFKYRLFDRYESLFEHKTHTARAILFPLIVWFLFVNETLAGFVIGASLVVLDLVVLAIDAYSEKESRNFMGGLPRWEYIIHLFANAFHFSAIALVLALKLRIEDTNLIFVDTIAVSPAKELFHFISVNVMPGAIILAILHLLLLESKSRHLWNHYRAKISCC